MLHLLFEEVRRADRMTVGVLDDRGDATDRRGGAASREVLARGVAWILKMDVAVDHAGQDIQAACLNAPLRLRLLVRDARDRAILDVHVPASATARAHD